MVSVCVCARACKQADDTHVEHRLQQFGFLSSGIQCDGNGGEGTTGHLLTLSHQLLQQSNQVSG